MPLDNAKLERAVNTTERLVRRMDAYSSRRDADDEKIEAHGVKGVKSTQWRKTFKNQAAFEKWLDANGGDVEVYGTRKADSYGHPVKTRDNRVQETGRMDAKEERDDESSYEKMKRLHREQNEDPSFQEKMKKAQEYIRSAEYKKQEKKEVTRPRPRTGENR